jgi:hypothetical protein
MTDEQLRLGCLKLAVMHYKPTVAGFGDIQYSDARIIELTSEMADKYLSYVKTGIVPNDKAL